MSWNTLVPNCLALIQAPMAGVQGAELALAVSSVGALGSLPCAMLDVSAVRDALQQLRIAHASVNVNFFCYTPATPDAQREATWRAALLPYYRELGVDPQLAVDAPVRKPFGSEMADLLDEFKPALVSFHFGLPSDDLLGRVRGWGAKVISSATTVEEALWLQARGVDGIIAQGVEAGGHRGMFLTDDTTTQIGTLALVPQIVRRVRVPVIAAGGIADARGVAAALALGAVAVQVGTAYLLCPEARTSAVHRAALQSDAALHTALTRLFSGRPARGVVNRIMRELGANEDLAPSFPLAGGALAPLRQAAELLGKGDFSALWSGQNTAGCKAVPAAQLTLELARGLQGAV